MWSFGHECTASSELWISCTLAEWSCPFSNEIQNEQLHYCLFKETSLDYIFSLVFSIYHSLTLIINIWLVPFFLVQISAGLALLVHWRVPPRKSSQPHEEGRKTHHKLLPSLHPMGSSNHSHCDAPLSQTLTTPDTKATIELFWYIFGSRRHF